LIQVRDPAERAVLVAAPRKGSSDARHVTEHLEELTRLVDTAGAEVVGRISQQITAPNPATLIGEGKVEEVAASATARQASLVIFDEELSPVQGANLEQELQVRVMDRAEVILDIFSTRARSHEAKLQVELAQLEYLLPRLTRMWTHLSRIRGGIGLRGPGETQLETDRRIIRRRIQALKAKLKGVERHRENLRAGRDPMLSVALVGYTNAGKSSILRGLSGQHEIVVDPDWEGQMRVVERVLAELSLADRPLKPVFNKIDAVADPLGFTSRVRELYPGAITATTMRTDGLVGLKTLLRDIERVGRPAVRVRLPVGDGARLAALYRDGDVQTRVQDGTEYEVLVRLDQWQIERLKSEGVEVREAVEGRTLRKAGAG
jgi:50S ribosomal subunit-associated GTPase HflX